MNQYIWCGCLAFIAALVKLICAWWAVDAGHFSAAPRCCGRRRALGRKKAPLFRAEIDGAISHDIFALIFLRCSRMTSRARSKGNFLWHGGGAWVNSSPRLDVCVCVCCALRPRGHQQNWHCRCWRWWQMVARRWRRRTHTLRFSQRTCWKWPKTSPE